ncbi:hypothetical protein C4B60_10785 [Jeotgalibacillus proteolyticus]|uniref:Uncharacterized protein n=2 Tax=Jeotgalibacillus proteolyticus TaxID=2082395 RepID=A0A2S5GAN4_9BACL|nr:hypothetical protein C4B60_10785 [Jeotgalibacillus proteolyticus]
MEGLKKLKKYRVHSENDCSFKLDSLEEAERIYENWKDDYMCEGVRESESYVEIAESEDDFEDYKVIKKVVAVIDHDRHELGTPKEEGFDWDYWAKWLEVVE